MLIQADVILSLNLLVVQELTCKENSFSFIDANGNKEQTASGFESYKVDKKSCNRGLAPGDFDFCCSSANKRPLSLALGLLCLFLPDFDKFGVESWSTLLFSGVDNNVLSLH